MVAFLGLLLYLPRLGVEILRSPLEVKYALAAREMLEGTSPLLVPHLFGELYPDKPPLYFWLTAALARLTGGHVDELTARLPAALAAVASLVILHRLGVDAFGPRAGLLAASALATSNLFFWYARQGHPDQLLTAWVTLACFALWRGFRSGPGPAARRLGWTALAYAAMGGGVLSKGLLGLLLPLFAGTAYLVLARPLREVPRRLGLVPGLGVFLVVVLAWYGPAVAIHGRDYLYETLVHQHVIRYAHGWVHGQPWHYYLRNFPVGFLPWVVFLPGAMVLAWRTRDGRPGRPPDRAPATQSDAATSPGSGGALFALVWFVTGFVFLNLSTTKRDVYLLPLYPAAALLVGWLWDREIGERSASRWIGIPVGLLVAVVTALAAGVGVLPRRLTVGRLDRASRVDTLIPVEPWQLAALALLLVAGAAALWWLWRRRRPGLAFLAIVVIQAATLLAVAMVRAPAYEARYPVRAFVARVREAVPAGQPVASTLRQESLLFAFYQRDPPIELANSLADLVAVRTRATTAGYALVDGEAVVAEPPGVHVLAEARFDTRRVLLVRIDPPP